MRLLAGHDTQGNIHYIVATSPNSPLAAVTTETGLVTSEIEAPDGLSGLSLNDPVGSGTRLAEVLRRLQDFRVLGNAKLIRKT